MSKAASTVGKVALGVVGAVLAPVGFAAVGFMIGMSIGGMIFPGEPMKTEGPRIGDTAVTTSSLGKVIPEHYGTVRTSGNIIWSAGLKELKEVEVVDGGGKGGGGGGDQEITSYTYFASFAVAFGMAPALSLHKIWADGKLIYDATSFGETSTGRFKFRFYTGGDGKASYPDPLIEESINRRLAGMDDVNKGTQRQLEYPSINTILRQYSGDNTDRGMLYYDLLEARKAEAEGAGDVVPDYRMTPTYERVCYVVFDDFPLQKFGNRIPNITAEIEWNLASVDFVATAGKQFTPQIDYQIPRGMFGVSARSSAIITSTATDLRQIDQAYGTQRANRYFSGIDVARVLAFNAADVGLAYGTGTEGNNALFAISPNAPSVIGTQVQKRDGTAWAGPTSDCYAMRWPRLRYDEANPVTLEPRSFLLFTRNEVCMIHVVEGTPAILSWEPFEGSFDRVSPPGIPYRQSDGRARLRFLRFNSNSFQIWRVYNDDDRSATINGNNVSYNEIEIAGKGSVRHISNLTHTGWTITGCAGFWYDNMGHEFDSEAEDVNFVSDYRVIFHSNEATSYLVMNGTKSKKVPTAPAQHTGWAASIRVGSVVLYGSGRNLVRLDLESGEFKIYNNVFDNDVTNSPQIYLGMMDCLFVYDGDRPVIGYIGDRSAGPKDVSHVIREVCLRSGLRDDEIDVVGLIDRNPDEAPHQWKAPHMLGYSVTRSSTGRQTLDALLKAFWIDGYETDWQIRFIKRRSEPSRTIHEDDLGTVQSATGDVNWSETRLPEYELPAEVTITFIDEGREYEPNTATARRAAQPVSTMDSQTIHNIEFPIVILPARANKLAQQMLFLEWMQRDRAAARTSWKHLDLDPTDVVEVKFRNGETLTHRVEKMVAGANLEVDFEFARSGDPVQEEVPGSEVSISPVPVRGLANTYQSFMFPLDIPLLSDVDYSATADIYYFAVGGNSENWGAASVYRSDGSDFALLGNVTTEAPWGTVPDPLGPPRAYWATDEENQIHVFASSDANRRRFVSITREQMLAGENRALLRNNETGEAEIISFQNVESGVGNSLILKDLLRGQRGTDYMCDKHVAGETLILLSPGAARMRPQSVENIGSVSQFRAVSPGQSLSSVLDEPIQWSGRAAFPWAPSRVKRQNIGSDIQISWNRRARINGQWNVTSGSEAVPLIEADERYRIYLLPLFTEPNPSWRLLVEPLAEESAKNFDPADPTTYLLSRDTTSTSTTFTETQLSSVSQYATMPILVALCQLSTTLGQGFQRVLLLDP